MRYEGPGTLETIIEEIQLHDEHYPSHGDGCACHDKHAGAIRRLIETMPPKSKRNLMIVFGYVYRNP